MANARLIKVKNPKVPGDYLLLAEQDFRPPWERFEDGAPEVTPPTLFGAAPTAVVNDLSAYDIPERATPVRGRRR